MKHFAPATQRNRDPILEVLRRVLPAQGLVLELASGSGEHVVHFASHLRGLTWQPTDVDPVAIASIEAWVHESGLENIQPPIPLDATSATPPITKADAVLCINMIHISPFEACIGLMRCAAAILPSGGTLVTYGPYKIDGAHTAPSNAAFDANLKARDPRWGVRDVSEVSSAAGEHGLTLVERVAMRANNFTLVFRRA
ncbi:MAG TPA: DUF938 domain-containing protein [Myxococcota bacterium]|nr:DUF938 domain-containing protein [Myxococcota bacterium]